MTANEARRLAHTPAPTLQPVLDYIRHKAEVDKGFYVLVPDKLHNISNQDTSSLVSLGYGVMSYGSYKVIYWDGENRSLPYAEQQEALNNAIRYFKELRVHEDILEEKNQ